MNKYGVYTFVIIISSILFLIATANVLGINSSYDIQYFSTNTNSKADINANGTHSYDYNKNGDVIISGGITADEDTCIGICG